MKKVLSLVLCIITVLSCFQTVLVCAVDVNKLKSLSFEETTLTLSTDSYGIRYYNINYKAVGEDPSKPVEISWRSTNPRVATVSAGKVGAVGIGTCQIIAYQDGSDITATCTVTVKESIAWKYALIQSAVDSLPADWQNPSVYSQSAITGLQIALDSVEYDLEDTPVNCTKVQRWYDSIYNAKMVLLNSEVVSSDDEEFFGSWNEAYNKIPDDYYRNLYTAESTKVVSDLVTEVYGEGSSRVWLKSEKDVIDDLAARLLAAIANLRPKTTQFKLLSELITKYVGSEIFQLEYTSDGYDTIVWSSDNEDVAKVDEYGNVTIVGACPDASNPYVTITAKAGECSDFCKIKVLNPATGIRLSQGSATISEGDSLVLDLQIFGTDSDITKPVTGSYETKWTSTDTSVAEVSTDGVVFAKKPGTAKINVSFGTFTATCNVTVLTATKVSQLVATATPTAAIVGGVTVATVMVYPRTATNKEIKWTSSDENIVTVTSTGTDSVTSYASAAIRGVAPGKATITYSACDGSGVSGKFKVEVSPLVSSIKFDKESLLVCIYDENDIKITASILPVNAGNQTLSWVSSDESVAKVSSNLGSNNVGVVEVKKVGNCTISAFSADGTDVHASCDIQIVGSAKSMKMSDTSLSMKAGESATLSCTVLTNDGGSYPVTMWESSDKSIAAVGKSTGKVVAKLPGKVTISAVSLDGKKGNCTVNVTADLEGISLPETMTLAIGKTKTLVPVYEPEYATNKKVSWKSSDTSVVTVSQEGKVSAKGRGNATVTATSEEGEFVASCKVTVTKPATGISLSKTSCTLTFGTKETYKLKATVTPSDATDKTVTWKSSKTSVAKVSSSGTVTAAGPGTATITVATADGGHKATCKVTVLRPLEDISFAEKSVTFYVGQQESLKVVFTPHDASNKKVSWSSSKKSVVNVDSNGVVTAIKAGSSKITAKANDGGYTASVTVKVIPKVDVTKVKLNKTSTTIDVGKTETLKATVSPSDASVKSVKWATSNKAVATVNSSGKVTAKKGGTATITCTTTDQGKKATCKVTVYQSAEEISVDSTKLTLLTGKSKTVTATVLPENATNKSVKWSSSDKTVATVSSKGKITPLKSGTVTITATSKDNEKLKAVCVVTVNQTPEKISLSQTTATVSRGSKMTIRATVSPSDTYDKSVEWSSNAKSVAKVSSTGVVTALKAGIATITCKSKIDPNVKKSCVITVTQPVTGVKLSATKLTLTTGRIKTLVTTVLPSNATNKAVSYKSSDKSVATVSSKGLIEAIGPGTATVTVTTKDGLFVDKCSVTVVEPVISVKLDKSSKYLAIGKSFTLNATILPQNATNKTLKWTSSKSTVARVTQSGKVTALKEGTVTITVISQDGSCKATCKVTCVKTAEAVTLDKTSTSLSKGKTVTLKATVFPSDASVKTVTWSSSDTKVATVDAAGKVTAVGKGTAIITCKTKQGGYKATCTVKVK